MNDKTERRSLADLLRSYAPRPSRQFDARLAQAPWRQEARARATGMRFLPRLAGAFAAAVIVVALAALAVPDVRASLSAWLGLGVSKSDVATPPAVPPAELVSSAALDPIAKQAGWTIVAPTWVPEGYRYNQAYYDTRNNLVSLSFLATRQLPGGDPKMTQTKALTLVQSRKNDMIPLQVAPTTSVQDVTIGKQPGAYAVGAWKNEFVPKAGEPGGGHMQARWRNDLQVQNVFWQVGEVYTVLISDDAAVTRQDMLKVAGSVK